MKKILAILVIVLFIVGFSPLVSADFGDSNWNPANWLKNILFAIVDYMEGYEPFEQNFGMEG